MNDKKIINRKSINYNLHIIIHIFCYKAICFYKFKKIIDFFVVVGYNI